MGKLFKLNVAKYLWLDARGKEFEGDDMDVTVKMLGYGICVKEINYGFEALISDDMAEFGINKTFVFSKKIKQYA